jgi:hypothetical protein
MRQSELKNNPYRHKIEMRSLTRDSALTLHPVSGGAAAIRFKPVAIAPEKTSRF